MRSVGPTSSTVVPLGLSISTAGRAPSVKRAIIINLCPASRSNLHVQVDPAETVFNSSTRFSSRVHSTVLQFSSCSIELLEEDPLPPELEQPEIAAVHTIPAVPANVLLRIVIHVEIVNINRLMLNLHSNMAETEYSEFKQVTCIAVSWVCLFMFNE